MPLDTRPVAIVSDIDGVLADNWHRFGPIHEAHMNGTAPDWTNYTALAHLDVPIAAGRVILGMARWRDTRIILLTGRREPERNITYSWLEKHAMTPFDRLIMRKEGDSYHDFKVDRIRELSTEYRIQLILEDDVNICDRLEAAFTIPVLRVMSHWSQIRFAQKEHQG